MSQLAALEAADCFDEVTLAGERGGGKSYWQCGFQEDGALRYGDKSRGIMFRKTYAELEELQLAATEIFPTTGAVYKTQPSAKYPLSNCWYWPSGATVKMRYLEAERDYGRYHGHQYTRVSFDEVTEYASPTPILKMISTLRSAYGVPCRMALTGNPGGIGHVWMRGRIFMTAPYTPYDDPETGLSRIFIPSKLNDNRDLRVNDPGYIKRLLAATQGNDALRKAWLEGDWDVLAGAFFNNFSRERHVIRPFQIPQHWTRFASFDWGSAKPFSVGWWAISNGEVIRLRDGRSLWFPAGSMIRYREWYGKKGDEHNVGLKMFAEEVAQGIITREKEAGEQLAMPGDDHIGARIAYRVADPACYREDGGPSIAERMARAGCIFRAADNARVAGWDQMRARFEGEDGAPLIYIFNTCTDFIRTVPSLIHDKDKLEDLDTDGEDHAADEARYACMSRPLDLSPKKKRPPPGPKPGTMDWVMQYGPQPTPKKSKYRML